MNETTDYTLSASSNSSNSSNGGGGSVVSIAAERRRRDMRNRPTPETPRFEELDMEGIDFTVMSDGAKQLYWFNVTNYARHLYASAFDSGLNAPASDADRRTKTRAIIRPEHIQEAERVRLGLTRRREAEFGLGFMLDAFQIVGAALCGALATKPQLFAEMGYMPLATALAATAAVFFAREYLSARLRR